MSIISKSAYYAKEAFKFVMRIVLPFIVGIFLNWVFALVFFVNWLGDATWSSSIFTILLTIIYYPSFEIKRSVTNKLIEQLIPKEDRKETAIEMGLQVSATQNFNNLLKLSTPFLASIISELVKFL